MKREQTTTTAAKYDLWRLDIPPMPALKARMIADIIAAVDPDIKVTFEHCYASLVEEVVTPDGNVEYRTTTVKVIAVDREVKEGKEGRGK